MNKIAVLCDSYRNYEGWRNIIGRDHWDKFHCVVHQRDTQGHEFTGMIIIQGGYSNPDLQELERLILHRTAGQVSANILRRANQRSKEESQRAEKYKQMLVVLRDLIEESEGVSGFHCNGDLASWNEVFGLEFINELEKLR